MQLLTRAIHRMDVRLFDAVARHHAPALDKTLPRLSHAADYSRLWLAMAAVLAVAGGRFGRRAALRGVVSLAGTSAFINGPVKWIARRARPEAEFVPILRRLRRTLRSSSFPSGHAASAAAFATAVSLEVPAATAPAGALAAAVAYSRIFVGVHYPSDVLVGAGLGAAVALATRRLWPLAPHEPAHARPVFTPAEAKPSASGAGLAIVVNPGAGPPTPGDPVAQLREALPKADVIETDGEGLVETLQAAAKRPDTVALGVAGGDGSVNTAAAVAAEHALPLIVIPTGTLNHLARDLGLGSVDDAVDAVREGRAVAVDLATIDGRVFLNTASIGSYAELVDARERLENRIGKWPALFVALAKILRTAQPVDLEFDGVPMRAWMVFIGNCAYEPGGFAPTWRERLDDGMLDVRLVDASPPLARLRLLAAVLTGTLDRSPVHVRKLVRRIHVRSRRGPLRLARDGETFDGNAEFTVSKRETPLPIYVPSSDRPAGAGATVRAGPRRGRGRRDRSR